MIVLDRQRQKVMGFQSFQKIVMVSDIISTLKGCFWYFEVVESQDIFPELSASGSVTSFAEAIPLTSYDFVEEEFDFVETMLRTSEFDSSNSGCDNQDDRVFVCVHK